MDAGGDSVERVPLAGPGEQVGAEHRGDHAAQRGEDVADGGEDGGVGPADLVVVYVTVLQASIACIVVVYVTAL